MHYTGRALLILSLYHLLVALTHIAILTKGHSDTAAFPGLGHAEIQGLLDLAEHMKTDQSSIPITSHRSRCAHHKAGIPGPSLPGDCAFNGKV